MPRVVPSQVVDVIDSLFPASKNEVEGRTKELTWDDAPRLSTIVELAGKIPENLLVLPSQQYAEYVASLTTIQWFIGRWQTTERVSPAYSRTLLTISGLPRLSPVTLIRRALAGCPDEFPSSTTTKLAFLGDPGLADSLRLDLSTIDSALSNGEWKAATVLSGSVIEALLLWALEQRPPGDVQLATKKLVGGTFNRPPPASLDDWVLFQYIEVAVELKIITADTAVAARLAKDFRNLIHPGRAKRFGQECNRGTALSAVAALEHVVNDLTP